MNNEIVKEENPLFPIARKRHNEQFMTWEYDFLHLTPANENTYILGFCAGVGHASDIFSKQISEMQQTLTELDAIHKEQVKMYERRIIELEKQLSALTVFLNQENPQT